MKESAINWFEIYVSDFARAKKFYETICATEMEEGGMEACRMAFFPYDAPKGTGGALTQMEGCTPGAGGTVVYLNVEGDLDGVLSRVEAAGGKIVLPRKAIPPHGFIGLIGDSEGNIVGLHSMQ